MAQLVEHLLAKERVAGSSPVSRSISGCGSVWLERLIWDQEAAGSSPVTPMAQKELQDLVL